MFKINLIVVGKIKEKYFSECVSEYAKRLQRFCELNIIEIKDCTFTSEPDEAEIQRIIDIEGKEILKKIKGTVFSACVEGNLISSEELSKDISSIKNAGGELSFVIGGSYGLSDEVKNKSAKRISFSRCTFTHTMFRTMLVEQIYRSFMIACGSTYHK